MRKSLVNFLDSEDGVTAIEYGLIGFLIATVIIVAVSITGTNLSALWQKVANCVSSVAGAQNATC